MYRKHHNGQLSIEEFHVPFGGTLDPDNRWVLVASLMPSDEIEEAYAPQLNPTHDWGACKACTPGVRRAVHQAAAWLDR
jgi:hypothetical protein